MTMYCRILVLLAVLWLGVVKAQRVYQRACDCEYMVNGKCAYTLLLPSGGQSQQCDSGSSESSDLDEVRTSLSELQDNVDQLSEWSSNQTRIIAQLQSDLIVETMAKLSDLTSGGNCDNCDDAKDTVTSHAMQIDIIKMSLESLRNDYGSLGLSLADLNLAQATTQNALETGMSSLQGELDTLTGRLASLERSSCTHRSVLVSGERYNIHDDNITASSYNDTSPPASVRITSDSAWCPVEPNADEEWIQFVFEEGLWLTGVITRGRADYSQWVTSYRVKYAYLPDGAEEEADSWRWFTDELGDIEDFQGNLNQNGKLRNDFWTPMLATHIRIVPMTSYKDRNKCIRADVIGCLP